MSNPTPRPRLGLVPAERTNPTTSTAGSHDGIAGTTPGNTDPENRITERIIDTASVRRTAAGTAPAPVLDVVVPVYNEQGSLAACIERLVAHLRTTFPYPFRITVADNASTDATWAVAQRLCAAHPEVGAARLAAKGRGRALKAVWSSSDAAILAYMDVDLSTDLDGLWPLVAPLMSGHSDVAIGSRLAKGSRVVRGDKREFISRSYNALLRLGMGARFSDAQCGFKAIRADVAAELLPYVQDHAWFFDTELLVLAERAKLRIHEVPVDWFDDPDSRVDVLHTALDDLAGMARVRRSLARREIPVDDIAARIGRGRLGSGLLGQVGRFAGVGVLSTVVHLGLFAALVGAGVLAQQPANVVALLVGTVVNTGLNRAWTFEVKGRRRALRHQAEGLAIFGLTWAFGAAALAGLGAVAPGAPTWLATAVVAVANVVATATKFLVFRSSMAPEVDDRFVPEEDDADGGNALRRVEADAQADPTPDAPAASDVPTTQLRRVGEAPVLAAL